MSTMKTIQANNRKKRLLIFRVLAILLTVLLVAVTGSEFIPAWVLGDPGMSIHLWHIAELLALLSILLGGTLLSLLHKPEEKSLLAQFFVLSMIVASIALMPFEIRTGVLLLIMVLFIAAFPNFRALLSFSRQGPISISLLVISFLMALLLTPTAYHELQWQILGMTMHDPHAMEIHWIGSALLMGLLVLGGILAATRRPGWKMLGIIVGITYSYLGVTAMMIQDSYAGSWSGGYGLIAILAGGWYIIGSLAGAQMLREAEVARELAAFPRDEDEDEFISSSTLDENSVTEKVSEVETVTRKTQTAQPPETQELTEAL